MLKKMELPLKINIHMKVLIKLAKLNLESGKSAAIPMFHREVIAN